MKAYLKARKYLELYVVADKALVSFGIIISSLISPTGASQGIPAHIPKSCEVTLSLAGKWDL